MNNIKNIAISSAEANKIIPRAEFRVFGKDIIPKIQEKMWDVKATLYGARTMPKEIYFLSAHTNSANVKVRDGLLDIKIKVGETPEGYEFFQPKGKFQFPVKKDELQTILTYLATKIELHKSHYQLSEFLNIIRTHPNLSAPEVEKIRYGFTVDGIICEYAKVWFNGALVESACCESEDLAGMQKVIKALAIDHLPNTNYIIAAKRIIGM